MFDLQSTFGDDLHAVLREAAENGPTVVDSVSGAVVVLRHAEVERLAHDRRLAGVGLALFEFMGIGDGPLRAWYGGLMFTNEGEPHHRLRSLVSRAFTPRAVEALRADAATLAKSSLEPVAVAGGGDLVAAFGLLPMRVMCRLLGVPERDVPVFAGWADALSPIFGFMSPEQVEDATDAIERLLAYVGGLVEQRTGDPGPDLITSLLAAEVDGGKLTHDEVIAMVANLLVGGHDTTASQLGCTLLALVRHPGETSRVRADPSLISSAVSETIRYEPAVAGVPRTAAGPLDVAGTAVEAGAVVLLSTAAANREPGVWRDPERLDVRRFVEPGTPRLLSFGAGPHYCLGAALARMTVEEAVRALLDLGPVTPAGDPDDVVWRMVLGRSPERVLVDIG